MQSPKKEVIIPKGGSKPLAPYSPGIRAGNLVFTSGQIALDPATGKLVEGGIEAEARQALNNLKAVLEAAGSNLDKVVKVTVFLNDINDYGAVNEVYGTFFTKDPPARSAFQVANLPAGALIEIEAVALVKES
ncbi:MAG: RidA family protein [Anaerolineales bacterium]|jgi:2-iminobutanoate/2-iminopropanoate deaminase